jgi:release factor glutamine methyltransferase
MQQTVTRLERGGIDSARAETEWIVSDLLHISKTELYFRSQQEFPAALGIHLEKILQARLQRQPLQYILGHTEFYGRRFACDARALIPRPETEILVETVTAFMQGHFTGKAISSPGAWDIGTGGGNIAVTLAAELPNFTVLASDIDLPALQLSRENAVANKVSDRVMLLNCSLFGPIIPRWQFAAICANPPYISPADAASLPSEVRDYEPARALFAPEDGLSLIRRIIAGAKDFLAPGGLLALEIGYNQAAAVRELCAGHPEYTDIRLIPDLAGHLRVATAVRA